MTSRRARLSKVEAVAHASDGEKSFRLLFRIEADQPGLAQQTYSVSHATLGRAAIFVSPNDAEGRLVEAVFNRG